jgi:hypothetical protein
MRAWLNSSADAGNVVWLDNNPPISAAEYVGYDEEAGFLSDNNFTQAERNLMKTVTQWTMLDYYQKHLTENGLTEWYYGGRTEQGSGTGRDGTETIYIPYDISEFPNVFYGAAYQSTDTVFLPDELQLYAMWKNFGSVNTLRTDESRLNAENTGGFVAFILRSGFNAWNTDTYGLSGVSGQSGIRPAFYLNELAVGDFTGSGTEQDPYVLTNNPNYISVQMNAKSVPFDQPPIMENNRVLVPFRAIFEAFGAEVEWDSNTKTVTAQKDGLEMSMQIDNNTITINGKTIALDVPPRLINSRTLVPVRAVSEGLGATVDWDSANNQVKIITE